MFRRKKKDRGAIDRTYMAWLQRCNDNMFKRRLAGLGRCALTSEEYVQLFVAPEHQQAFIQMPQLVREDTFSYREFSFGHRIVPTDEAVTLRVKFNDLGGVRSPFVPSGVLSIREDAPPELVARINVWLKERYDLGVEFGVVRELLETLNVLCRSKEQVRYFLPAILTLCKETEALGTFAEEIQSCANITRVPTLPVKVRNACRTAAATITSAALLNAVDDSPTPVLPCEILLTSHMTAETPLSTHTPVL